MDYEMRFRYFNVLLKMQKGQLELRKLLFRHGYSYTHMSRTRIASRGLLTHFAVPVLANATSPDERIEPRLYTATYHGMQTLIRRLLAPKQVQYM